MLVDTRCLETCALRRVSEDISAALRIGWDLTEGCLFPIVEPNGTVGTAALSAPRMTTTLQSHLRTAKLPDHYTMLSCRVGGSLIKSLAGTTVDQTINIGSWKTEQAARLYTGATTSRAAGATSSPRECPCKRKLQSDYATAMDLPLSPAFQQDFAACSRR